jgi:hypothetical protein
VSGCSFDGSEDVLGVVGREDEHLGVGMQCPDALGGLHAVETRHSEVHQNDVRLERLYLADRLFTVGSFADHIELLLGGEHALDAGSHHGMVVDDKDSYARAHVEARPLGSRSEMTRGSWATRIVPSPGVLSTSSTSPSTARRALSPRKPSPPLVLDETVDGFGERVLVERLGLQGPDEASCLGKVVASGVESLTQVLARCP